eukprot:scaffold2928_cov23-Tisochrysis_lutea.AAC.1
MAAGKQAGVQNCLGDWQGQSWRRSSPSRYQSLQVDTGTFTGCRRRHSLHINTGITHYKSTQAPIATG